jgi:hypothetical protein
MDEQDGQDKKSCPSCSSMLLNLRKNMERDKKDACHPERSEGSLPQLSLRLSQIEMLRSAQHDTFQPFV